MRVRFVACSALLGMPLKDTVHSEAQTLHLSYKRRRFAFASRARNARGLEVLSCSFAAGTFGSSLHLTGQHSLKFSLEWSDPEFRK